MFNDIIEFADLADDYLNAVQKQFNGYQLAFFPTRTPEFFCLELNGEAGELANIEKKQWKGKPVPHESFEDEAADVLIALMNYCNARDVDLGCAVREKLLKIEKKRAELKENGEEY